MLKLKIWNEGYFKYGNIHLKIPKKFEIYKNEMDKNILNYNLFAMLEI